MNIIARRLKSNQGSMLILTLITISIIMILGVAAINVATTESKITNNEQNRQKALAAAEAGIAHAMSTNSTYSSTPLSGTVDSGYTYSVTKVKSTTNPYEYTVVSTGTAKGITKKINTKFTIIKDLNEIKGPIVGDNVNLQINGYGGEGEIEGEDYTGNLIANSSLTIGNGVEVDDINLIVGSSANSTVPSGTSITKMNSKVAIPQIDTEYYRKIAQEQSKVQFNGNFNPSIYATVNGVRLYFFEGDLDISSEFSAQQAIIIATGNITINAKVGEDDNNHSVVIYGNNVYINGAGIHSGSHESDEGGKTKIEGFILAKDTITLSNKSNITGALIAPNISTSVANHWEIEFNTDLTIDNIKLVQNKLVSTWTEN